MKKIGSPFIPTIRQCHFFFCPNLASASLSFALMSHLPLAALVFLREQRNEAPEICFPKEKKNTKKKSQT